MVEGSSGTFFTAAECFKALAEQEVSSEVSPFSLEWLVSVGKSEVPVGCRSKVERIVLSLISN